MKMATLLSWTAAFVSGALVSVWLLLNAMPNVLMNAAIDRIQQQGVGYNEWSPPLFQTASSREVVMPAPDLSYSACIYDLADGPLLVSAEAIDGLEYWSLSGFDHKTVNFFTINDLETHGETAEIVLTSGRSQDDICAKPTYSSPTRKGIMLIRRLAPTKGLADALRSRVPWDVCAPIDPNTCKLVE